MLVYDYYEGDDVGLARLQHDVYGQALGVMEQSCERQVRAACAILDLDVREIWQAANSIDHRTLQVAHDIVAANWRYLVRPPQGDLLLNPAAGMSDWLNWLKSEVDSWTGKPELVSALRRVLTFQNSALGYAAEANLKKSLFARYDVVPWRPGTAERRQW